MSSTVDPFSPQVAEAVCAHMNADHADDSLLIVRSLGGQPDATDASMTGVGPDGARFDAVVGGATLQVTVPWAIEIVERSDLRVEVVRMYHEACAALGVEPRQAGEH